MPTMSTALAMEGLLQYNNEETLAKKTSPRKPHGGFLYSPALYATPEPGPIPDVSSIDVSPNIYVVNHKRRVRSQPAEPIRVEEIEEKVEMDVLNGGGLICLEDLGKGVAEEEEKEKKFGEWVGDVEIVEEGKDDFLDPRDSMNVGTSGSDVDDGDSLGRGRLGNHLSARSRIQDKYYDTAEEFFSDGSFSNPSPSLRRRTENELRLLNVSLIEESSKRKVAEENLLYLNKQYEKLLKFLCCSRSSLPESLNLLNLNNSEIDPAEICQEFVVLKSVSGALETDLAKDEVQEAFAEIIVTKNHEISRLRDRMMYYEAMNREMSQRNLETVDLARKRRLRTQRMRKWIWSCVGFSVAAGAALLAYSYHGNNTGAAPSSSETSAGTAE